MISDYGGTEFWQNVATKFYKRVKKHERLRAYFTHTDADKLQAMASDLWQISLGECGATTAQGLSAVHEDLRVTPDAFHKFIGCYVAVLREEGVTDEDLVTIEANLTRHLSVVVRPE